VPLLVGKTCFYLNDITSYPEPSPESFQ